MSATGIDPDTGLPALAEGHVWRVKWSPGEMFEDPGWYIQIETEESEPRWSGWMPPQRMIVGEDFWDEEYRQVPDGRTWYGKKLTRTEKRVLTSPRTKVVSRIAIEHESDYPTSRDVLAAAERLLDRDAERDNALKLVGVYPPNKLENK